MARVSADQFAQYVIISMAGCPAFEKAPVVRSALQFAAAATFARFAAGELPRRTPSGGFAYYAAEAARRLFDDLQALPGVAAAWTDGMTAQFRQAVTVAFEAHSGEYD